MKKIKNITGIAVVVLSTTVFLSAVKASDIPKEKPASKTGMIMNQDDGPDLRRVELGFHYMPTFYSMDFRTLNGGIIKGSVTLSHGFGGMLGLNLSRHIGLQGEIDYYKATQKFADESVNCEVNIKYLDIPLLLSLNTNKAAPVNLNAVIGPQFGINMGSDISTSGSTTTAILAYKKGDVGAAFGAGLEFALSQSHNVRLDLGYRGFYGFVKMDANKTGSDTYNVVVNAARKTNAAYARLTFVF